MGLFDGYFQAFRDTFHQLEETYAISLICVIKPAIVKVYILRNRCIKTEAGQTFQIKRFFKF